MADLAAVLSARHGLPMVAGSRVSGIAVHTGARIAAAAQSQEVLASATVKDLVAGSGIRFDDRGSHMLKGCARRLAALRGHFSLG